MRETDSFYPRLASGGFQWTPFSLSFSVQFFDTVLGVIFGPFRVVILGNVGDFFLRFTIAVSGSVLSAMFPICLMIFG